MNCSICGTVIPNGQTNCPSCGAMVQQAQPMQPNMAQPMQPNMAQPMQPNMGQPMQPNMGQPMQPAQPAMNQGGFKNIASGANMNGLMGALKSDVMKLVGLVGALLLFLSPFLSWCTLKVSFFGMTESDSANMFGLAGGETKEVIFPFLAIILIAVAALLIIMDIADFVPAVQSVKSKLENIPYFEFILIGVALIVVIIALLNGDINDFISAADMMGKGSHGIGPVFAFLGIIAAAVPRVLKIVKK